VSGTLVRGPGPRTRERPPAATRPPRPAPRLPSWLPGLASAGLLGAFAVQLALIVPRHEVWFDEAQAWLLARDSGLVELFTQRLRYEGSPGLWHLLLMPFAKAGLPITALGWIGAACALAGAVLLVRRAPFPLWARAGVLFAYPIGYQYAAVARSYTLMPLLLFAVAAAWRDREARIGRLAVLLGLLANVSLHGLLVAGALAGLHGLDLWRRRRDLAPGVLRAHLRAGAALAALGLLLVVVLVPPADLANGGARSFLDIYGFERMWYLLASSLTGSDLLLAAVLALLAPLLRRTGTLALWALPTVALLALSSFKYHAPHHEGLPFLVLVTVLWIALDRDRGLPRSTGGTRARRAALVALAAVLAVQGWWWWQAYEDDWAEPYSGTPALAAHLAALPEGTVIYGSNWQSIAVLPWFRDNPYANYNRGEGPGYYLWQDQDHDELQLRGRLIDVALGRPDVVVWAVKFPYQLDPPRIPGYAATHVFPGEISRRSGPPLWGSQRVRRMEDRLRRDRGLHDLDAFVVLEPVDAGRPAPAVGP